MIEDARLPICCPFCGSPETHLLSLFGQQLLTVQYYCRSCRTPFERVRGDDIWPDARRHALGEMRGENREGNDESRDA